MLILYHEINSIGHKLKKVVGKAILFCKLTELLLFFDQEGSTLKIFATFVMFTVFLLQRNAKLDVKLGVEPVQS